MIMQRPSNAALIALTAFVLACFSATLYMWIQFGGPVPLKPQAYRIHVALGDARGLAENTDIRIAGVSVGKVTSVHLDQATDKTIADLQIQDKFAPRPVDTHVTVRQKSLLGEAYVELSAGSPDAPKVPEGGTLNPAQVETAVSFADVIGTFTPSTRVALQTFLTDYGAGLQGGAPSLSTALAALQPLAIDTGDALKVVNQQSVATASLIREGGSALGALTERQGQFGGLIANSARVFRATGARDRELADAISILPTFLDEAKAVSARVADFSDDTTPLIRQLQPAAAELTPNLRNLRVVAPGLRHLLVGLKPLTRASGRGVPAFNSTLDQTVPLLARAKPYLGEVNPVIDYLGRYKRDISGFAANTAAVTQATLPGNNPGAGLLHYARGALPIAPESLAAFPQRFGVGRANPYPAPDQGLDLGQGLLQYGDYTCVNRALPSLDPGFSTEFIDAIKTYYTDVPDDPPPVDPPSPACKTQAPLGPTMDAGTGLFPQLKTLP